MLYTRGSGRSPRSRPQESIGIAGWSSMFRGWGLHGLVPTIDGRDGTLLVVRTVDSPIAHGQPRTHRLVPGTRYLSTGAFQFSSYKIPLLPFPLCLPGRPPCPAPAAPPLRPGICIWLQEPRTLCLCSSNPLGTCLCPFVPSLSTLSLQVGLVNSRFL